MLESPTLMMPSMNFANCHRNSFVARAVFSDHQPERVSVRFLFDTDINRVLERIHGWSGANWVGMVVWGYLKEIVQWNRIV